jgi:glycosyltransferase involved in cell wall biosynthesis
MPSNSAPKLRVLLVAPNLSRDMGGEALKALEIMTGLAGAGLDVTQITHVRAQQEVEACKGSARLIYIGDDPIQTFLSDRLYFGPLNVYCNWLMHRRARAVAQEIQPDLVHFTSPISPTLPYFSMGRWPVVIGPLNGNIYNPPGFAYRESWSRRLSMRLLRPYQAILGLLFSGKRNATLLVAGGERTKVALEMAGSQAHQMIAVLDSGVSDVLAGQPRIRHEGVNHRFVFAGRLVNYKGCDLVIKALRHAPDAHLDVIGDGDERPALEALCQAEEVTNRVTFHGWVSAGEPVYSHMRRARAFVFPSLAEANGIVVQESMMIGLPVISLNWGGSAALVSPQSGILIDPGDEAQVVAALGAAMHRLGRDGVLADAMAANGRQRADEQGFAWSALLKSWIGIYESVAARQRG